MLVFVFFYGFSHCYHSDIKPKHQTNTSENFVLCEDILAIWALLKGCWDLCTYVYVYGSNELAKSRGWGIIGVFPLMVICVDVRGCSSFSQQEEHKEKRVKESGGANQWEQGMWGRWQKCRIFVCSCLAHISIIPQPKMIVIRLWEAFAIVFTYEDIRSTWNAAHVSNRSTVTHRCLNWARWVRSAAWIQRWIHFYFENTKPKVLFRNGETRSEKETEDSTSVKTVSHPCEAVWKLSHFFL